MATTTNYGWTTPDDTDLVKNGADAIRVLGTAIDTSMNTALGTKKSGLVLLNTTSFSGVASQSINNVFSATYDNYKIILSNCSMSTAAGALRMRLRVGGSDNSTASSYVRRGYNSSSASLTNTIQSESFFGLVVTPSLTANNVSHSIIELFTPFTTVQTGFTYNSHSRNDEVFSGGGGYHNQTVSYDGFTIFTSNSNNFAGTISVYGFNE
jgi:hypothetical protein